MAEKQLKQAFLLNSIKFVGDTYKSYAEKMGISLYLMDEATNFSYLIEDLRPQVIITNYKDIKENLSDFLVETNNYPELYLVLTLPQGLDRTQLEKEFQKFQKMVSEPINPKDLFEEIEADLESYLKRH